MRRTFDPTVLNAIANSPAVRPGMGRGTTEIDVGPALADLNNYALADEHGGFLMQRLEHGRYELHTLLDDQARGAAVLERVAVAIRYMFAETDCVELVTRVPGNLKAADLMARRAGFREVWNMDGAWPGPDGPTSLRLFAITLDEWMVRDDELGHEGDDFHALLKAAGLAAGDDRPLHPNEDRVHDNAAGMACLMLKAGNVRKALWAYGRWAIVAGYRPVDVVTENPLVLNVGNALVQVRAGSIEVVRWTAGENS